MLDEMAGNAALSALLSAARAGARRRHHVVVRAAHVVEALFASPGMDRRIRKLGVDADHLRDAAIDMLAAIPAIVGYRDAKPPELCPSIVQAAKRAEAYVDQYGTHEIVPALVHASELRAAFLPYVIDESIVERVRQNARGSDCADALAALFDEHIDLAARLSEGGLDPEDLTTKCGRPWREIATVVVRDAREGGYARVEPATFIAHLTREVADASGYEPPEIARALDILLHGAEPVLTVADDVISEVVFVNDPLTPYDFVCGLLTDQLGYPEHVAVDLTLAIDARESAIVAEATGAEAREHAHVATTAARRAGHPLRVLVRPRAEMR